MTVVLIPRERNNEAFVAWLEDNIAPRTLPRQPYVRRYGQGWANMEYDNRRTHIDH